MLPNALNLSAEGVNLQHRDSTVDDKERQWKS